MPSAYSNNYLLRVIKFQFLALSGSEDNALETEALRWLFSSII